MPCSDYNDYQPYRGESLSWIEAETNRQRLDNVTRVLCETIAYLAENYSESTMLTKLMNNVGGLHAWYIEHQERDRRRKEHEAEAERLRAIRNEAVAKLTPEERKVLGV